MADYQWRATATFNPVGPNTLLTSGAIPSTSSQWQTGTIGESRTDTHDYYFHDANNSNPSGWYTDDNSTRVRFTVHQEWTSSVDDLNNLTIHISTTLGPVYRDDKQGVCNDLPARDINWYTREGGSSRLYIHDDQVGTTRTLYNDTVAIKTYDIVLAPGADVEKPSLYVHNETTGYGWYDDVWAGVQFKNILPSPTVYTLTYDANGGSGAPSAQTTTTAQTTITFTVPDTTPTWGQYRFLGWSFTRYTDSRTEADVEYRPGDTVTMQSSNASRTLYAVWEMEYRPGEVLTSGVWKSTNRSVGKCNLRQSGNWVEMKTVAGHSASGNPPSIRVNNSWVNQEKIGDEN